MKLAYIGSGGELVVRRAADYGASWRHSWTGGIPPDPYLGSSLEQWNLKYMREN